MASVANAEVEEDESGNKRTINNLHMNRAEVFTFTLKAVKPFRKPSIDCSPTPAIHWRILTYSCFRNQTGICSIILNAS